MASVFSSAPCFPKDAIFALTAQFKSDTSPLKVNLGQGAYRDNQASPWILLSVAEARRRISNNNLDHEYLPILGLNEFRQSAPRLVLGDSAYSSLSSQVSFSQMPCCLQLTVTIDCMLPESFGNRRSAPHWKTPEGV